MKHICLGNMCQSPEKNVQCIHSQGSSYIIYEGTGNWFDARTSCSLKNATLAVLSSQASNVIDEIANKKANMWIGLRYEDYFKPVCHGGKMNSWFVKCTIFVGQLPLLFVIQGSVQ